MEDSVLSVIIIAIQMLYGSGAKRRRLHHLSVLRRHLLCAQIRRRIYFLSNAHLPLVTLYEPLSHGTDDNVRLIF